VQQQPEAIPPLDLVLKIQERLAAVGAPSVVGGSGLLYSLGHVTEVRGWDLVTDAPPSRVRPVLGALGLDVSAIAPQGDLVTERHFRINAGDHTIDILVKFRLRAGEEIREIPATPGATWRGLVMARPEEWALVYTLVGRSDRAAMLSAPPAPPIQPPTAPGGWR